MTFAVSGDVYERAPGGAYCASLAPGARSELREECFRRLGEPHGSFTLTARAWAVRGAA